MDAASAGRWCAPFRCHFRSRPIGTRSTLDRVRLQRRGAIGMAADETDFGTELRGYKKDDVDKAIQELRHELLKANTEKAEAAKEAKRLQAVAEDLQAELDETGRPTYTGLGTRLENVLRVAEEQS